MALGSRTHQSSCVNPQANILRDQNKLIGSQNPAERFHSGSNKVCTFFKALTLPKASIPSFGLSPTKNLFTIFKKVLIKTCRSKIKH